MFGNVLPDADHQGVNAIRQGDTAPLMGQAAVAERLPKWNQVLDAHA